MQVRVTTWSRFTVLSCQWMFRVEMGWGSLDLIWDYDPVCSDAVFDSKDPANSFFFPVKSRYNHIHLLGWL